MLTFSTEIFIKGKSPQQIYDWMLELDDEKYKRWHREHLEWKTLKRTEDVVGSTIFFDEWIGKLRFKFKGEITEAEPNRLLVFKLKHFPPAYFLLRFEPADGGTKVVHEVGFGFKGVLGAVFDALLKLTPLFKYFAREMERHAQEEFKNLEKVIR